LKFYDFHVHSAFSEGKSSIEEIANQAKLLGFSGICLANYFNEFKKLDELKTEIEKVSEKAGIEIYIGFEARTTLELSKLRKARRSFDVLLVRGHDLNLNRKAVETPEVDILTHPEFERRDSGLNHIMAKLAARNNVAIEINFREILLSSKNTRAGIIHKIRSNVELCKKYNAPIIICSGAISHWQLRDPKILASMGCLLGLELCEAKRALSEIPQKIIKNIRERQDERWIRPGVKVL
jgi:ribonuclease P/MRP protein subunit RPP1